jgi:uncharacterized protein YqgC (DUF456 family)
MTVEVQRPGDDKASVSRRTDIANTALGVSTGAVVGSLIGISILPGIGIALAPAAAAVIGGILGNYATRIAAKLHK